MLRARDLRMTYDGRTVLDVERFDLSRGEVLALLGPNGSGKTTLLETLAFLRRPTTGSICLDGEMAGPKTDRTPLRKRVVLVEQYPILFTASVRKNVEFSMRVRGVAPGERRRKALELLSLVGLSDRSEDRGDRLSGGQVRRAAIARALACDPEVLLLDEPTSNVDMENRSVIERLVKRIGEERMIPIVFSTHSMIQAGRLSTRSLFLYEGKISVSANENIFTAFVEIEADGTRCCVLPGGLRLAVPGAGVAGPTRVSVGPEGITLDATEPPNRGGTVLRGKLYQLVDHGEQVRLRADVGVPIGLLMEKAELRRLGIMVGDPVWLTIPPEVIRIYPAG